MKRSATVLRHIAFEDLGLIEPLLISAGYDITYVDATTDNLSDVDPSGADLLVILGGPIGVYEDDSYPFLIEESRLIETRLSKRKATLGICLGAQLMAKALGAKVYATDKKEIGFSPLALTVEGRDSCLAGLEGIPVLHWHGDQFDIPAGAQHLGSTAICANQAFSLEDFALGLQFHLEVDVRNIERWLVGHAVELSVAKVDPRTLREQAAIASDRLNVAATKVVSDWLLQAKVLD